MNKRGISAIVATVLIILITVAAVAIIWAAIIPMIQRELEFTAIDARLDILTSQGYTFYDPVNKMASVQIKRVSDEVAINWINIVFLIEGDSVSSLVDAPKSGSTKVYFFNFSDYGEPESVSVNPIFTVGGREKEGSITSDVVIENGNFVAVMTSPIFRLEKDYSIDETSLINSDSWTIGTGDVARYIKNGLPTENKRVMGTNPYGNSVILWEAIPNSANDGDGGWTINDIPIDPTKTYRSTVWIKKTGSNDGNTYFGCHAKDPSISTNNLDGSNNTNPYFFQGDLPELDRWYFLVGYIHGSGDPSTTSYGGVYDGETGEKVGSSTTIPSVTDYKNNLTATHQGHRTYLYYDTTTTDRQYFWNPTFVEVSNFDLPIDLPWFLN